MIDITRGVMTAQCYPGDPSPELRSEQVEDYLLSTLSFCVHTGTHVDAPLHYLPNGQSADRLNVECLSGRCLLVEKEPNDSELALMKRRRIEILLIKSGFVTQGLLFRLRKFRLKTVGNDQLSIAPPEEERVIHEALFRRGILPLECLNLDQVAPGLYKLLALPMLIEGAEAAPVRAFLSEVKK